MGWAKPVGAQGGDCVDLEVDAKDLLSAPRVRRGDIDHTVDPPGPKKRRVKQVRPVCRRDNNHLLV